MAAANQRPLFVLTPNNPSCAFSTADTSRTSPTTGGVLLLTAGANGSLINWIHVNATATTAAGVVRIFRYDGSAYHLIYELLVAAITVSNTALGWQGDYIPPKPKFLNAGDKIYMSTSIAQAFDASANAGDY